MAKKKTGRARTEARERLRQREKLFEARSKLALLEPGGTPERPMDVDSASVVQTRAETESCLRCDMPMRCIEHGTAPGTTGLVRRVDLQCRSCGTQRTLYLRIVGSYLN